VFRGERAGLIGDARRIRRVLDLCTGSGCLAVLASGAFPEARIDATEISAEALAVARRNVEESGAAARIRLLEGDLFAPVAGESYDLIIANPPYVDAEGMAALPREYRHEPALALDGGADGLHLIRRMADSVEYRYAKDTRESLITLRITSAGVARRRAAAKGGTHNVFD